MYGRAPKSVVLGREGRKKAARLAKTVLSLPDARRGMERGPRLEASVRVALLRKITV